MNTYGGESEKRRMACPLECIFCVCVHKKYDNVWPMLRAKSSNSSKSMHFKIIKFAMEYYCCSAWAVSTYGMDGMCASKRRQIFHLEFFINCVVFYARQRYFLEPFAKHNARVSLYLLAIHFGILTFGQFICVSDWVSEYWIQVKMNERRWTGTGFCCPAGRLTHTQIALIKAHINSNPNDKPLYCT